MNEEKTTADEPKVKKNPKGGWDVVLASGKIYKHYTSVAEAKKGVEEADIAEDKTEASGKMFS